MRIRNRNGVGGGGGGGGGRVQGATCWQLHFRRNSWNHRAAVTRVLTETEPFERTNTSVFHACVHSSTASALRAIEHITDNIHKLDSIAPDAPKFILGDFNYCSLNKT